MDEHSCPLEFSSCRWLKVSPSISESIVFLKILKERDFCVACCNGKCIGIFFLCKGPFAWTFPLLACINLSSTPPTGRGGKPVKSSDRLTELWILSQLIHAVSVVINFFITWHLNPHLPPCRKWIVWVFYVEFGCAFPCFLAASFQKPWNPSFNNYSIYYIHITLSSNEHKTKADTVLSRKYWSVSSVAT